jgi:hypothetical protein
VPLTATREWEPDTSVRLASRRSARIETIHKAGCRDR